MKASISWSQQCDDLFKEILDKSQNEIQIRDLQVEPAKQGDRVGRGAVLSEINTPIGVGRRGGLIDNVQSAYRETKTSVLRKRANDSFIHSMQSGVKDRTQSFLSKACCSATKPLRTEGRHRSQSCDGRRRMPNSSARRDMSDDSVPSGCALGRPRGLTLEISEQLRHLCLRSRPFSSTLKIDNSIKLGARERKHVFNALDTKERSGKEAPRPPKSRCAQDKTRRPPLDPNGATRQTINTLKPTISAHLQSTPNSTNKSSLKSRERSRNPSVDYFKRAKGIPAPPLKRRSPVVSHLSSHTFTIKKQRNLSDWPPVVISSTDTHHAKARKDDESKAKPKMTWFERLSMPKNVRKPATPLSKR